MAWGNETYLIGERVRMENEKNPGVITRIDKERGLIYVLYKRMREEAYPYPEVLDQKVMVPIIQKK